MKGLIWFVIRIAVIALLLGQAASPGAGAQLTIANNPPTPGATQQKNGIEAFTPLKTGTLPLDLHYVRTFGTTGIPYPADGQDAYLNQPAGLVIDPADNKVYVTENNGRRLHGYKPDGTPGFIVGTAGQDKEFSNPQDVTLYGGNLWVLDGYRILIYTTAGVLQQEIDQIDNTARPDQPNQFNCGQGLSFDTAGRLYVAQACSNNVEVLTLSGALPNITLAIQSVIEPGFQNPQAVQVADLNGDLTEEVYVSDNNQMYQCLDNGTGGWNCMSFGSDFQPRGMGLNSKDNSHLYVVKNDNNGPAVMVCDFGRNCNPYITNPQNSQVLFDPVDIAFDTNGNALITDRGDSTVKKFTSPTAYTVFAGTQYIPYVTPSTPSPYYYNYPAGVAVGSDYSVYIVEQQGQRLTKLADDGTFLWNYGTAGVPGNDSQHLNWAQGNPAVDSLGRVYVPDRNNGRVSVLDQNGNLLGYIGNQNDPHYQFNSPVGVSIGPNGDIYVVDQDAQNVQVYTPDRYYQSAIGVKNEWGTDDSHFNRPTGITVKDDLTVFVSDANNFRIQKCTRPTPASTNWTCNTFVGVPGNPYWDNDHLNYPSSVAWDAHAARLYVVDQNQNRILAFDSAGALQAVVGGDWGQGNNQFANPQSVAVDNVGNLYVADTNNQRVQKFIPTVATVEFAGQTGGPVQQLVRDGSTLYTSSGPRLAVYDLTDAKSPGIHRGVRPAAAGDCWLGGQWKYRLRYHGRLRFSGPGRHLQGASNPGFQPADHQPNRSSRKRQPGLCRDSLLRLELVFGSHVCGRCDG